MTEPWEMTAIDALAAMRARDLSPVELLESVERRADEVEPVVNALCERRPEDAREAAETSARAVRERRDDPSARGAAGRR